MIIKDEPVFDPFTLDLKLPIQTPRLILRPVTSGDIDLLHRAAQDNMDHLRPWMAWAKLDATRKDTADAACKNAAAFILREDFMFVARDKDGRFIGCCGLHRFDWQIRRFEVGFWIDREQIGQGYAGEIANALTRWAFAALHARAVCIHHADGNTKSQRAIEKLGFEKEGILKQALLKGGGQVADCHSYSTTTPDILPDLDVRWGAV